MLQVHDSAARWRSFFEETCANEISILATSWPNQTTLEIKFPQIEAWDTAFAEFLLGGPREALEHADNVLVAMCNEAGYETDSKLRIINLPPDSRRELFKISHKEVEGFCSSEVMVTKVSELKPRIYTAEFVCSACGNRITLPQKNELELMEPIECPDYEGGCGRRRGTQTRLELNIENSPMVDNQWIEVQELPENVRPGAQPVRLSVLAEADLAGKHIPGERIRINGIPYIRTLKKSGSKTPMFDVYFSLHSSQRNQVPLEEIVITPNELAEIEKISKREDLVELFVRSIAPSIIVGDNIMHRVKTTLMLQLFGGVARRYQDGTRTRGDIHILLLGDPGVAKSQLLSYINQISPRGRFTSGGGTTTAGLTAAVVRDSFADGRFSLEAGALVLSDMGMCAVDEFDKMSPEDQGAMHEAMEQQQIHINKAGISATMPTRCAVLAAANPKAGRFVAVDPYDEKTYIHKQINLPPALISRFDLVWMIRDDVIPIRDRKIGEHIIKVKRTGTPEHLIETGESVSPVELVKDKFYSRDVEGEEVISPEFLKKYVAHAKRKHHPKSDDRITKILVDYYQSQRNKYQDDPGGINLTARAIEATLRLAEAMARLNLRDNVSEDDAKFAVALDGHMRYMKEEAELNTSDDSGVPKRAQSAERMITSIVRTLIRELGGECVTTDVYNAAAEQSFDEDTVDRVLSTLKTRGTLWCPRLDIWRLA
jgi:replicative DNA helicase Mcm